MHGASGNGRGGGERRGERENQRLSRIHLVSIADSVQCNPALISRLKGKRTEHSTSDAWLHCCYMKAATRGHAQRCKHP